MKKSINFKPSNNVNVSRVATSTRTTVSSPGTIAATAKVVQGSGSVAVQQDGGVKIKGKKPARMEEEEFEEIPLAAALMIYISMAILYIFAKLRDFMRATGLESKKMAQESPKLKDFPPLYRDFESFYKRNAYTRIRDCWNRPISSVPAAHVDVMERVSPDHNWTFQLTGKSSNFINTGSYNYLGFAENSGTCASESIEAIERYGVATLGARSELGTLTIHDKLEKLVAEFIGKEDALVFGMGFATNATNIPILVDSQSLIVSDELNHTSLILGARLSGATIKVFCHNDMEDLERVLRTSILEGQPRSHRPWKKILIVVEGVYSMEGSLVNLPEVIRLKKKYKAYVYLDEAHSIGAMGVTGRGVVEHFGLDVRDVDIMMGTFTKSFGSAGGYIAADKVIIDALRSRSHAHAYADSMSPPIAQQIYSSMRIIMGLDGSLEGQKRIKQLASNAKYFRQHLKKMGFIVYGNDASPIVPVLISLPGSIPAFGREMLKRGIAVVVVGYPATPMLKGRVRFCLSAAHTREDLVKVLRNMDAVGDLIGMKYSRKYKPSNFIEAPPSPEIKECTC